MISRDLPFIILEIQSNECTLAMALKKLDTICCIFKFELNKLITEVLEKQLRIKISDSDEWYFSESMSSFSRTTQVWKWWYGVIEMSVIAIAKKFLFSTELNIIFLILLLGTVSFTICFLS